MTAHDSPMISTHLLSRPIELGEPLAILFPDGKGVTARFAGVDIEAGGSRFSIHCNQEGTLESLECTCPPAGIEALTLANADLIRERDHLREELATVRRLLDNTRDRADELQAAADNWEGMYRNLAEMTREDEDVVDDTDEQAKISMGQNKVLGEQPEFLPITVADGMVTINLSVYKGTP